MSHISTSFSWVSCFSFLSQSSWLTSQSLRGRGTKSSAKWTCELRLVVLEWKLENKMSERSLSYPYSSFSWLPWNTGLSLLHFNKKDVYNNISRENFFSYIQIYFRHWAKISKGNHTYRRALIAFLSSSSLYSININDIDKEESFVVFHFISYN